MELLGILVLSLCNPGLFNTVEQVSVCRSVVASCITAEGQTEAQIDSCIQKSIKEIQYKGIPKPEPIRIEKGSH